MVAGPRDRPVYDSASQHVPKRSSAAQSHRRQFSFQPGDDKGVWNPTGHHENPRSQVISRHSSNETEHTSPASQDSLNPAVRSRMANTDQSSTNRRPSTDSRRTSVSTVIARMPSDGPRGQAREDNRKPSSLRRENRSINSQLHSSARNSERGQTDGSVSSNTELALAAARAVSRSGSASN